MSGLSRRDPPPWLPALSGALAEALPRLAGEAPDPLLNDLIQALTLALERGDLAIDLQGPAPEGIREETSWPELHRQALAASALGQPPHGPLALDGSLVGWRRWLGLRRTVLEALLTRAGRSTPTPAWSSPPGPGDRQQQRAIRTALERDLLVLAGGPGTGKTSTVARILEAVTKEQEGARIHLAAPTGKAAARLRQATGQRWPCTTLHQLLESRGDGEFRRHRERPLKLDLLVVDEVSMVDLVLMDAVLQALPGEARLVLVGDPAQLPPVAPGAPLQDLLREGVQERLGEGLVTLTTAYRNAGTIARLAAALRERIQSGGETAIDLIDLLQTELRGPETDANLHWHAARPGPLPAVVRRTLTDHQQQLEAAAGSCIPGTDTAWPELMRLREGLLVLSPRHRGPWGVDGVHQQLLGAPSTARLAEWPSGTPVICTRNRPDLGLSNGDLGVLVVGKERWLVFGQEQPIWLYPSQLTGALEPALALTVHKAQGSEVDRVMVLLAEPESLDPRLLYTALTRAREEAWIFSPLTEDHAVGATGNQVRSSTNAVGPMRKNG